MVPEKGITKEAAHFDASTAAKVINTAKGQYRVMFSIAALTGLRRGEILALQRWRSRPRKKPAHRSPVGMQGKIEHPKGYK